MVRAYFMNERRKRNRKEYFEKENVRKTKTQKEERRSEEDLLGDERHMKCNRRERDIGTSTELAI
jgi:hypothetical protein